LVFPRPGPFPPFVPGGFPNESPLSKNPTVWAHLHLPPYLVDVGIPAMYGAYAVGLIGPVSTSSLDHVRHSFRPHGQAHHSCLALSRPFGAHRRLHLLPPSVPSTLIFSALIGFLWLSTVPPTQQIVAIMFGTRYMATLFGFCLLLAPDWVVSSASGSAAISTI